MEEQTQTTVKETATRTWSSGNLLYLTIRNGIFVGIVACVFALVGTALGAANYIQHINYASWLLITWMLVDMLLVLLVCLYGVLYLILLAMTVTKNANEKDKSASETIGGGLITFEIVFFIGCSMAIGYKHFAWVSVVCLLFLIGAIIINTFLLASDSEEK